MTSLFSCLKKGLVVGLALAVTGASVFSALMSSYSALMSSYQYIVPSEMGVCAMREYHAALVSHQDAPLYIKGTIGMLHLNNYIPECEFNPLIPTRWINWLDTPAQSAVSFSMFRDSVASFVKIILRHVVLPYVKAMFIIMFAMMIFLTALYVLFVAIRLTRNNISTIKNAWKMTKKVLTTGQIIALVVLLLYLRSEAPVYVEEMLSIAGSLYDLAFFFLPIFIAVMELTGTFPQEIPQKPFFSVMFWCYVVTHGLRLCLFSTVIGLALWYYGKEIRRRVQLVPQEANKLIQELNKFAQFDETVPIKIKEIFLDVESGAKTAVQTLTAIDKLYRSFLIKLHPDHNAAPTATRQFQILNEMRKDLTKVLEELLEGPSTEEVVAFVGKFWLNKEATCTVMVVHVARAA